ncbi:MAG: type II toxin-antitoxin system VapC family toxin [Candidatus Saccharimonadales bacterium]
MILLDANIIIHAFKPQYAYILHLLDIEGRDLGCSDIVRLEVMGFRNLLTTEKTKLDEFFADLTVLPIDSKIIDLAIKIRQQKPIACPDSIIAATSMQYKSRLWTNNVKDFGWIKGLDWHDPITAGSAQ